MPFGKRLTRELRVGAKWPIGLDIAMVEPSAQTHTITRADLAGAVYREVRMTRSESAELVETVLEEIAAALERREPVKLSGLGSFVVRFKGERIGRNPKNGVVVTIPAMRVLLFRPSRMLKGRMNGGQADG